MRAIRAAAGLVLAAGLALTGCDDGPERKTGNGVREPLVQEPVDPRGEFLSALEEAEFESWAVDAPPEDEIAAFPEKWCRAAAAGHSVTWMLEGMGSDELYPIGPKWGTKVEDARQVVVIGVMTHCPEHEADVISSLRDGTVYY